MSIRRQSVVFQAGTASTFHAAYRQRSPLGLHRQRHGAVLVEFAVVAPLLFLFFFAGFEFCRVAMIRHTVDNAIYEGARRGIIPGGTNSDVDAEARRVLSTIGLNVFSLSVTPAVIDDNVDEITVRLTVPLDVNTFVPAQYFVGREITRELTMRREGR